MWGQPLMGLFVLVCELSCGAREVRSPCAWRGGAELGQESQASSCVEEFNSSCLSNCSLGDRPFVDLYVELAGFSNDAGGCQTPSFCAFVHRIAFEEVS